MVKSKKLKVGIIGIGNMGANHLRVLASIDQVELVFIYDINRLVCKKYSKEYDIDATVNLQKSLKKIDALVIATPTSTHFDYIKIASKYVKNIFVEKPLTDSLKTTCEIYKFSQQNGLNIQVGYIERFNQTIDIMNSIIKYNKDIASFDFARVNRSSSRIVDVDVIVDLMVHDIDLAVYFNGNVKNIYAYGKVEKNMVVFAKTILQHENGVYSKITASRITDKNIRRVLVKTANIIYLNCDLINQQIFINKRIAQKYYNDITVTDQANIDVNYQEPLLSEILSFINLCNAKENKIPGVEDSLTVMEIANNIQRVIQG